MIPATAGSSVRSGGVASACCAVGESGGTDDDAPIGDVPPSVGTAVWGWGPMIGAAPAAA